MKFSRLLAAGRSMIGLQDNHTPYRMRTPNFLPNFDSPKNPFKNPQKGSASAAQPMARPAEVAPVAVPEIAPPCPTKAAPTAIMETRALFSEAVKPAATPILVTEAAPEPEQPIAIRIEPKISMTPVADIIIDQTPPPTPKPAGKRSSTRPVPPMSPLAPQAPTLPPVKRTPPASKPKAFADFVKKVNPLAHLPSLGSGTSAKKSRPVRPAVQGELSLEKVKVVRNDLSDSDLEVVTKPKPAADKPQAQARTEAAAPAAALSRLSKYFGQSQASNVP